MLSKTLSNPNSYRMKPFLLKSGILAIVLIITEYILQKQVNPNINIPLFPFLVIFFWGVTNIIHYLLFRLSEKNVRRFNPAFMGLNMIKMLIYFIFALAYLWFYREHAVNFIIGLFILYTTFSFLEIREISNVVKRKK